MLLDVSAVTKALQNLLKFRIPLSPGWAFGPLNVSALPPDRLKDVDDVLSIYLFHITEDGHFKNAAPAGNAAPPVASTPMTLQLYYILTANSKSLDDQSPYFEQQVMGLAVKTLRDTPTIDDTTMVGANQILPAPLRGMQNRVRISLEPVSFSDAPHYWTAGQQPLRLAAYYQVTAVMLEPEESRSFAPPVLRYGVYAFARTGPRLDSSASTVTFTSPDDGIVRTIEVRPAEAPIGGLVRFPGFGLRGEVTTLTLSYPFWSGPIDADAAWNVVASENAIEMTVQPNIGAPPQTIVPGVYSAHATVGVSRQLPDGTFRRFEQVSNEMPFSIAPRIDGIGPFDGARSATIAGAVFADANLIAPGNVAVLVGFDRLEPKLLPLDPGTFNVVDATHVQFRLPAAALAGERRLVRVFVNGVESAPRWVTVP